MRVSVVIPTRNRADMLEACLGSLVSQSIPADQFEVIVVDNGSTDTTPHVAARYAKPLQLRYQFEPEPGLHVGRHAGLRLARSDVLVFADDDIVGEPTWLSSVARAFADPAVVLVGGNNLPLFEKPPPAWLSRWWDYPVCRGRALPYLSILDFGQGVFDIDPHFIWGCNFSIRRQVLVDAGGFHPDAMPKEKLRWRGDGETHVSEWVHRAGLRAVFDSGATVLHRVSSARMRPEYMVQRAYAQGISDSYTDLRRAGFRQVPVRPRAWRLAREGLQRIRLRTARAADPVECELRKIKLDTLAGYRRGYDFHQQEVRADPALFDWVMKKAYL